MTMLNSPQPRRRQYSPEFKIDVVAACQQPGTSVSSVAIANGINTNVVRRWVKEHEHGRVWTLPGQPRTYLHHSAELKRIITAQLV